MDISRQSSFRSNRSRDPLERRMDQWFETGRQFVDGVAGNRPGQRKKETSINSNRSSIQNAGRWVGEKLDWFFEEEEDWQDNIEPEMNLINNSRNIKRPLEAISLRVPKAIPSSVNMDSDSNSSELWPDDTDFRIDRWQRSQDKQVNISRNSFGNPTQSKDLRRPLPKSSRRKN